MATDAFEPHPIIRLLDKPAASFTPDDLVRAAEELELRQVNLRYVAGDGRLKTLAFPIRSRDQLREVLVRGERVDGSSIFPDTGTDASDVYIVPRWRTAFINPFGEQPSMDLMCSFYDEDGQPLLHAREQIVRRAAAALKDATGYELEAMGELEYYIVEPVDPLFEIEEERGYQDSPPFSKRQDIREEVLDRLRAIGVAVKYAHAEVGNIREPQRQLVQGEIEFVPVPIEDAADAVVLAKWIVREVAWAHGVEATFAPSVSEDGAGNGLHVHTRLVRDGDSVIADGSGLTDDGRRVIAGYLGLARSLTAFGNTVPSSYLRLTDGEESPEAISWGERDRTGLVRVPLAWTGDVLPGMLADANPGKQVRIPKDGPHPQTIELRLGDGSADIHLLMAGIAVAARRGLEDDDSLRRAERLDTSTNKRFEKLPVSCAESATALAKERAVYERDGVFPAQVIDATIEKLRGYDDAKLLKKLAKDQETRDDMVRRFWHVG